MDRKIVYPGQIPLETDLLGTNQSTMIALGKLSGAIFGTAGVVNGLAVGPNSPAALNVVVSPGEIYSLQNVDGTAYSSLPADLTHTITKQGIQLDSVVLACPAPTTAGFSINYLIEAAYAENDINNTVLPYFNASNPSQAYSGPNNTGASQATTRAGQVQLQAKAGVSAATGTQTTPALDPGFVALAVVTVANGQTTITAGNISTGLALSVLTKSILAQIYSSRQQVYTTSGSFTVPAGVTTIYVSGCAGGGGGGASGAAGSPIGTAGGGGGGGAGKSAIRTALAVTPGQVLSITVGAAGLGGTINPGTTGSNGGTGGSSSVGSLLTLSGGFGGQGGQTSASVPSGGIGGNGFPTGSAGTDGTPNLVSGQGCGGAGASSPFGGGGGSIRSGAGAGIPGFPATGGYGAGGGGGSAAYNATLTPGQAGGLAAPGIIIIEW